MFENRWEKDPHDWESETFRFWVHRDLTRYAKSKKLENIIVAYAQSKSVNDKSYVVFQNGQPIEENTGYESILYYIDAMSLAENYAA